MPCQWLTELSVVTSTLSSLLYSCSAGKEKENKSKTADLFVREPLCAGKQRHHLYSARFVYLCTEALMKCLVFNTLI